MSQTDDMQLATMRAVTILLDMNTDVKQHKMYNTVVTLTAAFSTRR